MSSEQSGDGDALGGEVGGVVTLESMIDALYAERCYYTRGFCWWQS